MATTLTYTNSAFQPFTKIVSATVNQYFTDIKSRINWAGGTSATTGLGDDNIQSVAASGGGLTRATKLKLGTAYAFISNSSTGAMQDVASAANQTLYTSGAGVPTAGQLPALAGGTGLSVTVASQAPGDVIQVNSTSTAFEVGAPTAVPAALRIFQFQNFF